MKLVVDINVLVSGSLWRGNPSRLVDALLDGSATLCASALVMAEFEEVIQQSADTAPPPRDILPGPWISASTPATHVLAFLPRFWVREPHSAWDGLRAV